MLPLIEAGDTGVSLQLALFDDLRPRCPICWAVMSQPNIGTLSHLGWPVCDDCYDVQQPPGALP